MYRHIIGQADIGGHGGDRFLQENVAEGQQDEFMDKSLDDNMMMNNRNSFVVGE